MKKLFLRLLPVLLLPTLLLTSCKEKESQADIDARQAKALAGTYDYRRVGDLNYNGLKEAMNVSGIATITYDGINGITITLADHPNTTMEGFIENNELTFYNGYYQGHYSSEELSADFGVWTDEVVYDIYQNILVHESYRGDVKMSNSEFSCTGSGLLSFTRQ